MSSAFLDDADLERLTGYKRTAQQIRWLSDHGIPFILNAKGRPVVMRSMDKSAVAEPETGPVR